MKKTILGLVASLISLPSPAGFILSPEVVKMQQELASSRIMELMTSPKEQSNPEPAFFEELRKKPRIEFYEKICGYSAKDTLQRWLAVVPSKEKDMATLTMSFMESPEDKTSPLAIWSLAQKSKEVYVAKSIADKTVFQYTKNLRIPEKKEPFSYQFLDTNPDLCAQSNSVSGDLFKDVAPVLLEQYLVSKLGKNWNHSSNAAQGVILFQSQNVENETEVVEGIKALAPTYLYSRMTIHKEGKESVLNRWIFMHNERTYFLTKESNKISSSYQLYVSDKPLKSVQSLNNTENLN